MRRALALALAAALLLAPLAAANPATDLLNGARSAAGREVGKAQRALGDAPAAPPPPAPGDAAEAARGAYLGALDDLGGAPPDAVTAARGAQGQAEQGFYAGWYALMSSVRSAAGL